ncbi:hypothetical protein IFO70_38055 [Phormidium tenue FACHB-886]|nr:hypothetical protein [Phormidium tenue FACHB-886]
MGNLLMASVQIKGTRPLLFNHLRPSPEFGQRKERTGTAGNDPAEWQRSVLMVPETRQLYLLPTYIFGCWRDAARWTKRGKTSLLAAVASTLQVPERRILVDRFLPEQPQFHSEDAEDPVYVYMAIAGGVSRKGAKHVRYRVAAGAGWQCQFSLLWDKTIVSRGEMQAIGLDAGRFVGLGDGRAIGYGRFEVVAFEMTSD